MGHDLLRISINLIRKLSLRPVAHFYCSGKCGCGSDGVSKIRNGDPELVTPPVLYETTACPGPPTQAIASYSPRGGCSPVGGGRG